jgi:phenylpropionate dioxygenase-like ring-hydroxylating dioxygenase large terminal subunit
VGELHYASPWNWKILIENFCESYHHFAVHPETLQRTWRGEQSVPVPYDEPCVELRHTMHPDLGTFTVFAVFPTLIFAVNEPQNQLIWYDLQVKSESYFDLYIRTFVPSERAGNEEAAKFSLAILDTIHREDIAACERVHAGLKSQWAAPSILSELEQPIARFHRYLAERLSEGQSAGR